MAGYLHRDQSEGARVPTTAVQRVEHAWIHLAGIDLASSWRARYMRSIVTGNGPASS